MPYNCKTRLSCGFPAYRLECRLERTSTDEEMALRSKSGTTSDMLGCIDTLLIVSAAVSVSVCESVCVCVGGGGGCKIYVI